MTACEELKVNSQNDKQKIEKVKEMTYLKGFYEGVRKRASKGDTQLEANLVATL